MAQETTPGTAASGLGEATPAVVPFLPREHGTWAMLLVPWAVGCGVARRLGPSELLLLAAVLAAFLAHAQVMNDARLGLARRPDPAARGRARRRAVALMALAVLGAAPLVLGGRPALLLLAGLGPALTAVGVWLVRARRERALAGQLLAAVALPLSAPAAAYVAQGRLDAAAAALWLVNALFFVGAVLYVRMKIEGLARRVASWPAARRLRFAAPTLGIDVAILVLALIGLQAGGLSVQAGLAFAPVAVQSIVGALALHRPARLKRVGLLATGHAMLFGGLVIWLA